MAPYVHTNRFRIAMAEVDVAQIHFTALFRWMDRGLSEWLAAVGHPFTDLLRSGPGIPVVDASCRFLGRIRLDDELTLRTWMADLGRTSIRSRHEFRRGEQVVAEGGLVHVCVDRGTRAPVPVPGWLRAHATSARDDGAV